MSRAYGEELRHFDNVACTRNLLELCDGLPHICYYSGGVFSFECPL